MGSDYWFSLRDLKIPTSETGWSGSQPPSREGRGKRSKLHKVKRTGASLPTMCLPAYVLFFFVFLLFCTLSGFPLGKFARAFGAAMGEAEETGGGKTFFEKRKKKK